MAIVTLIHHMARHDDHDFPPNSRPALEFCLLRGARIIEVDVAALDGDDFLIAHDADLEQFSTGTGRVDALPPSEVGALRLLWRGERTAYPPMLLSEALDLVTQHRMPVELQLDLKEHACLHHSAPERLVELVRPVRNKVRITSGADWTLRRLRAIDPHLQLGFDPLLYLDWDDDAQRASDEPPIRKGAFGYWDDHPLAMSRWGSTERYLRERAEALWIQAPTGCVWYLSAHLVAASLDDGFDWIQFLHAQGAEVDIWTLDVDRPGHVALAQRMVAAGADRITTNCAVALAGTLSGDIII